MAQVVLKAEARPQKRARVIVRGQDGTLDREFEITEAQYRALGLSGAGAPPGVTAREWTTGAAFAVGLDMDVGDVQETRDGGLKVCLGAVTDLSRGTRETVVYFRPGEWIGTPPLVTVTPAALTRVAQPIDTRAGVLIISIVDGLVTL